MYVDTSLGIRSIESLATHHIDEGVGLARVGYREVEKENSAFTLYPCYS
jgi:hypothetical protein